MVLNTLHLPLGHGANTFFYSREVQYVTPMIFVPCCYTYFTHCYFVVSFSFLFSCISYFSFERVYLK
uniref:Putative ovule protein n=1 Tax=Solanum chacoense TaxID=4108 RepID=A0A0V0H9L8_SOLCH